MQILTILTLHRQAGGANPPSSGLVAQLDRVLDYESRGRGFESSPVHHITILMAKNGSPWAAFFFCKQESVRPSVYD